MVDYGSDGQIGRGESYEAYLQSMKTVFEATARWSLPQGVLWLIADSFVEATDEASMPSRLVPLPFELARLAEDCGWQLREVVIWRKDRSLPWTHRGRMRNAFEHILLFVKSDAYKYNVDRLRELEERKGWWVRYPERYHPLGIAPDNVWESSLPLQGTWASRHISHACPLPTDLVERMLLLTTDRGDCVFDPFAGVGTVPAVAGAMARRGYGIELNEEYAQMLAEETVPRAIRDLNIRTVEGNGASQTLLKLRVLKYPRELWRQLLRNDPEVPRPAFVWVDAAIPDDIELEATKPFASVSVTLVMPPGTAPEELGRLAQKLDLVASRAPLSKYRLDVRAQPETSELFTLASETGLWVYRSGETWRSSGTIAPTDLAALGRDCAEDATPPIVSPLQVGVANEEP